MDQTRDLWWEARQKSAAASKPALVAQLKTKMVSFPNRATTLSVASLSTGREKSGIIIDLNKYRTGRDLKKFVDAGVDGFALRIGGPGQWVMDNWRYTEDPSFRPYMEQLDKLGMVGSTIGYIIHNPFELWKVGDNTHLSLVNEWTSGGYMPGGLCVDHEVAECWQNGTKIAASPYNLVGSLSAVTDQIGKRFGKTVSVYTARWFINRYGPNEHAVYFDNVNNPVNGKARPMWLAWYPQAFTKEYADFQVVLEELLNPSGTQRASLLNVGNYSTADLWQFSDRIKLPGDPTGVDCNVTMGTMEQYLTTFGLKVATTPPPPVVTPPTYDKQAIIDWLGQQLLLTQTRNEEDQKRNQVLSELINKL